MAARSVLDLSILAEGQTSPEGVTLVSATPKGAVLIVDGRSLLERFASVAARKVAHRSDTLVVPAHLRTCATATRCFFERRTRLTTHASRSPLTPRTVDCGRKPGTHTHPIAAVASSIYPSVNHLSF